MWRRGVTVTQWRPNTPWSHLHHQLGQYLCICMSMQVVHLSDWSWGPLSCTSDAEYDLNWIHTGESVKHKRARAYKHSQSGSQYLLTWAAVLTASWCETGSCWLAWAWPAQCHWSHSPRLPACLPACLPASLPASPACSVYDIKARHS